MAEYLIHILVLIQTLEGIFLKVILHIFSCESTCLRQVDESVLMYSSYFSSTFSGAQSMQYSILRKVQWGPQVSVQTERREDGKVDFWGVVN